MRDNSANAKKCQKDGWKSYVRSDLRTTFTSEEDCVSYAAQGGRSCSFRSSLRTLCALLGYDCLADGGFTVHVTFELIGQGPGVLSSTCYGPS